jgi:hypothetical protein
MKNLISIEKPEVTLKTKIFYLRSCCSGRLGYKLFASGSSLGIPMA